MFSTLKMPNFVLNAIEMNTVITNIDQLDLNENYTYADYLLWQFTERVELIKGKIFKMSPAPSRKHQDISMCITLMLAKFLKNQGCKIYAAPFDVRLIDYKVSTSDNQIISVVQPDLCVICDSNKLDDKGCIGAPDLIIEILSPGNSNREMNIKFDLYQENSVKEYWIVNPTDEIVYIYVLENDKYIGLKPATKGTLLKSPTFEKLNFPVNTIFDI